MSQTHKILLGVGLVVITAGVAYAAVTHNPWRTPQPIEVTIPDGLRKEQIAFILADKLHWSDKQIEKFVEDDTSPSYDIQEGYTAPGTYEIPADATTYEVALTLRQAAQKLYYPYTSKLKAADWNKALIVASIVERDTVGHPEDRFERAKEVWADLDAGRPIESEGTIAYLKNTREAYGESFCDGKTEAEMAQNPQCHQDWRLQFNVADARNIKWWFSTPDDKKDDWKSFNTFLYPGLPARAIDNPGLDAVDAAVTTRFTPTGDIIRN